MPYMLPPITPDEQCREALMRSRVANWMVQYVRDQRATDPAQPCAGIQASPRSRTSDASVPRSDPSSPAPAAAAPSVRRTAVRSGREGMLPPITPDEQCREALMQSRVANWMAQRVRDQRAVQRQTLPDTRGSGHAAVATAPVPPAAVLSGCVGG